MPSPEIRELQNRIGRLEKQLRDQVLAARLERSSVSVDGVRSVGVRQTLANVREPSQVGALALQQLIPSSFTGQTRLWFTDAVPPTVALGHLWLNRDGRLLTPSTTETLDLVNIIPNPRFVGSPLETLPFYYRWTPIRSTIVADPLVRRHADGPQSLKLTVTATDGTPYAYAGSASTGNYLTLTRPGEPFTAMISVMPSALSHNQTFRPFAYYYDSTGAACSPVASFGSPGIVCPQDVWTDIRYTFTPPADCTQIRLAVGAQAAQPMGAVFWMAEPLVVAGAYDGPYFDGLSPDDAYRYGWAGVADQSPSTRATSSWVELADQSPAMSVGQLRDALATDDGFINVWQQALEPVDMSYGDLWYRSDANRAPWRWQGEGWLPLITNTVQSNNYDPAESGVGTTEDGDAQFQDLTVLGQLAVQGSVSTDTIVLGGTSLTETLGLSSIGTIISARLPQQPADLAISTTITKLFELNCGTVPGGRTYRASVTCLIRNTAAVGTTDRLQFNFRYTLNGAAVTTTSTVMDNGFADNSCTPSGNWQTYTFESVVDIATESQLKIGFTADLVTGAGSYVMYALSSTISRPQFTLFDDGPSGARQDSAITVTGGGTSRYVKTYSATWAYGVDSYNANELFNSWGSIGGADDMAGYVGFDSAAMVAGLAGAISPVSLIARWRPRTRVLSTGLDVRLGTHNFASSAATSAAVGGWTSFAHSNLALMGITLLSNIRNNTVPNTSYDESLGATVFNQFKAGTRKGLVYLGEPEFASGGEGSVYLDGTNQVQLIFTYDGTS